MYLVTASEMQEMDRKTIEDFKIPGRILMENAGLGAANFLIEQFPGIKSKKIGVIAGKGNNGGDGFVIARYLIDKGSNVIIYLLGLKKDVRFDAADNLALADRLNIPIIEIVDIKTFNKHKDRMAGCDLWVDAIFGTGLNSDVRGYFREVIEFINSLNTDVFSVDIPSGLNSDTGRPCGVSIKAKATATFAFAKIGHVLVPGSELTGTLKVVEIGIPGFISKQVDPKVSLITKQAVEKSIPVRPIDAHKGTAGHLLIAAGSIGKTGAAVMTATAALRCGAGLVTMAVPQKINSIIETMCPELMTLPVKGDSDALCSEAFDKIKDFAENKSCLAIGPGIGTSDETRKLLNKIVEEFKIPLVIDADGLNNLDLKKLKESKAKAVLTPHPGEMAGLIGVRVTDIQNNRIRFASDFAKEFGVYLVLKGVKTIVAGPDGKIFINPTGNRGMASGGMGDALTGIIAGLITQKASLLDAACAGVYIHGAAADILEQEIGGRGYLASDLIRKIPFCLKTLRSQSL